MYHDHETAGHPGELETTTWYNNTIGGQDFEHLWRTTYKAVECVNSLKSTDHHWTQLIKQ